jgi:hypothetical protein
MRTRLMLIAALVVSCSSPASEIAGAVVDAAVDAIAPDVREASAAEDSATAAPTTVDEVVCDKQYSGVVGVFAEKAYPGRSAADLARARVLNCNTGSAAVPGMCGAGLPIVKDGLVVASCGGSLDGRKVTFVVPPPI